MCLDDALSVMANQFDDPPGVDENIQVPLEEDIADSIPAHSLLADDEPIDMKPGCKCLLTLIAWLYIILLFSLVSATHPILCVRT